jgi:group I intron endonuclease
MENTGVYKITNIINNQCYIGSSKTIKRRWYEHKRQLRKNQHHSKVLQRAFNKYGENNFVFEILELCEPDELLIIEQKYFDLIKPEYIILKTAGRFDGYKHTEETKQILREKRKEQINLPCSEETKKKISDANKNRKFSNEHKDKLSKSHKGKQLTEEHKNKIKQSITTESMREKQKLSVESRKINKKPLTEKRRKEISENNSVCVVAIDDEQKIKYTFDSYKQAALFLGKSELTLWRAIKSNKKYEGYIWKRKKDYSPS